MKNMFDVSLDKQIESIEKRRVPTIKHRSPKTPHAKRNSMYSVHSPIRSKVLKYPLSPGTLYSPHLEYDPLEIELDLIEVGFDPLDLELGNSDIDPYHYPFL